MIVRRPRASVANAPVYCLSYTAVAVIFLPWASVPLVVTVRDFPSAATTTRPVDVKAVALWVAGARD